MLKFCLDSGHGGKDPGAVNGNKKEAHAALEITYWLKELLEEKNHIVKLTRTDDTYISLTERCNISNKFSPSAFISIHLNSAENKSASGVETLRYTKVGSTTKNLAANVQKHLVAATGFKNRGVKERDNLTVLKKTVAPAILVEVGFISNDQEAELLFNCRWQYKIAKAILKGIEETFF